MGQVANLRRVANPPFGPGGRPIDNRPQVDNLPHELIPCHRFFTDSAFTGSVSDAETECPAASSAVSVMVGSIRIESARPPAIAEKPPD